MKKLKKTAAKVIDELWEHRASAAIAICVTAHVLIMNRTFRLTNSFLTEKGIDPLELWNNEAFLEKK